MKNLENVVDVFAEAMKERLRQKEKEGFTGWDDPKKIGDNTLAAKITKISLIFKGVMSKKNLIDIANYAMFLWYRRKA